MGLSAETYPECNLDNSELDSEISMDEIINAIKFMKEGKAAHTEPRWILTME